jgi:hypothetical protein
MIVPDDGYPNGIREDPEQKMNRKIRQVAASQAHSQ